MLDPAPSLYDRLGGYDGVAAIVDDLLTRLLDDHQLAVYWKGKCKDSLKRDRQLFVEFFCESFGGPVTYLGRDMQTSHEGLGITEAEWNLFLRHVDAALRNLQVLEREAEEFRAAVGRLKGDVLHRPPATPLMRADG
jgi:hemoglobin